MNENETQDNNMLARNRGAADIPGHCECRCAELRRESAQTSGSTLIVQATKEFSPEDLEQVSMALRNAVATGVPVVLSEGLQVVTMPDSLVLPILTDLIAEVREQRNRIDGEWHAGLAADRAQDRLRAMSLSKGHSDTEGTDDE